MGTSERQNFERTDLSSKERYTRQSLRIWSFPILVFVFGIFASLLCAYQWNAHNRSIINSRLDAVSDQAAKIVKSKFGLYEYGLRGMRGSIITAGPQGLNRGMIEKYISTRENQREFPGARGFGFIRFVPESETGQFLATAKADGAPRFRIRELAPNGGDRFVIQYIYPEIGNEGATGLDIASEANRKNAAEASSKTGGVRLTSPITLVQADGKTRRGFLVLLPVYETQGSLYPEPGPGREIFGWVYAPLVVDEVLAGSEYSLANIERTLTDVSEDASFFVSDTHGLTALEEGQQSRQISLYGQTWTLTIRALPSLLSEMGIVKAWVVFSLGVSISAILAVFVWWNVFYHQVYYSVNEQKYFYSVLKFFRQPVIGSATLFFFVLIFALCSFFAIYVWQRNVKGISSRLLERAEVAHTQTVQVYDKYRSATNFLAASIESYRRAAETDDSNRRYVKSGIWDAYAQNSFFAYMLSSPLVTQARVIGIENGGRELVRVEYRDGKLYAAKKSELQNKSKEPYFRYSSNTPKGEAWVSDVTLNREYGEVSYPLMPTVRFVSPVYDGQGDLFAIVVLNVNAEGLLQDVVGSEGGKFSAYVLNGKNNFIKSPDQNESFRFEGGNAPVWNDLYQESSPLWGSDERLRAWKGADEKILTSISEVSPNSGSIVGRVKYIFSVPFDYVFWNVFKPVLYMFLAIVISAGGVFLLVYTVSKRQFYRNFLAEQEHEIGSSKEKERLFRQILESAPEAMVVTNASGDLFLHNIHALEVFGGQDTILDEAQFKEFVNDRVFRKFQKNAPAENDSVYDLKGELDEFGNMSRIDGTFFPAQVRHVISVFEEDQVLIASIRDLSQEKKAEQALLEAKEEALKASQAKGDFMANISHEIRTPLNAIIGLTRLLVDSKGFSEQQRDYLNKISLSGRSLLGIVNDVLDLAKIEANEMVLEEMSFSITEQISEIYSYSNPRLNKKI